MAPRKRRNERALLQAKPKKRILSDHEASVIASTTIDWDALRPEIHDTETYDKLIAAVQESTDRNENIAELKSRIEKLGSSGLAVAKKVVKLLG